jgi:hypothetical protein
MDTKTEMSWDQFIKGWMFLTSQPWGRQYRNDQPEAQIQIELYYKNVRFTNPYIWEAVCEAQAAGEHWPSIVELKQACHATAGFRTEQPKFGRSTVEWNEAPEPIAKMMDYAKTHDVTIREAAGKVLPQWIAGNPHHPDSVYAAEFLLKAKDNFGLNKTVQTGNATL